jgi:hypothetical protein
MAREAPARREAKVPEILPSAINLLIIVKAGTVWEQFAVRSV